MSELEHEAPASIFRYNSDQTCGACKSEKSYTMMLSPVRIVRVIEDAGTRFGVRSEALLVDVVICDECITRLAAGAGWTK